MQKLVIGVDLGGTKILYGIGTVEGEILFKNTIPTHAEKGPEYILKAITDSVNSLVSDYREMGEITGVAIAAPGPLAYPEGVVLNSPNLKWDRIELLDEMEKRLNRKVIVEKDTNIAALGEYYFGQNKMYRNLVYVTVSTGIGGGIIIDDNLYRGFKGGAAEIGHMVIDPSGELCKCGRRGCLEALVSGPALARQGRILFREEGLSSLGPKEIGEWARRGNEIALNIVYKAADNLAAGIANLANIVNPQAIILGGGVMHGLKDLWLDRVRSQVYKSAFPLNTQDLQIEVTNLGNEIGLYGCIAAVIEHTK